ncbi:MAG: ATP-binding protein [Dehalococcoidales bacterium]|nr:ATP-binding protein [Dehalococcoidales bacterium]
MVKGIRKGLVAISVLVGVLNTLFFAIYVVFVFEPEFSPGVIAFHLFLTMAACIAFSVMAVLLFSRFFVRQLQNITVFINSLVPGKPFEKLKHYRDDEIGELAFSSGKMAERFNESVCQLSSEKGKLELILSRMGDGIFVLDGEGIVRSVNPSAETIFGFSARTATGMSFIEIVRDYELDKPVRRCLKTKKPQQEYLDLGRDGLYLGMVVTPLATEPGCLVLIQDLSRLRKLQLIRKDFIANVSHELRTPVSSIKLLSETLRDGASDDPAVSGRFLNQLVEDAGKLDEIVQGMTTLARIESGEARLVKKRVDIGAVAKNAVSRLQGLADDKKIVLKTLIPPEQMMVMADPAQLEQVFYNIIHNGLKFTSSGGEVVTRIYCDHHQLLASISDTGIGIEPADLERIFERFYKADKAHSGQGSGLGLAISRHIIEAHGGRIWAEPTPEGHGSRISFSLPV